MTPHYDFEDIRCYRDDEYREKIAGLLKEPDFEKVISAVMPDVNYEQFGQQLLSINSVSEFQHHIIIPFLSKLDKQTTAAVEHEGLEFIEKGKDYIFMSNHRDIVIDATFLCYTLHNNGYDSCEIAIGNNLLIYQWISDLVRINKSFIVKRNTGVREALDAARQLSAYIDYTINEKHQSVWIAQREGRAKDSNDRTQEALIKMLALAGDGSPIDNLRRINIAPLSISYEYDPCDSFKALELLQKCKNPEWKKTPQDDLVSMKTGIMGYKGIINYAFTPCINDELDNIDPSLDKSSILQQVAQIIDQHIHSNYRIYKVNYIAYDILNKSNRYEQEYTANEVAQFEEYLQKQILRVGTFDEADTQFMHEKMLIMYANPLINKIAATHNG